MTVVRKKLIEVALPLEAINIASAQEKSVPRRGHPASLHLWWARRPLAACRAVLFGQLVDDPSSWPEQFPTVETQDQERQRLFGLITDLVQWENSNKEPVINAARAEIARSLARGRKAEGTAEAQDEAVLRVPPSYGADGRYREQDKSDVAVVNRYLAEVAPPVHDPFAGGGSIPLEAQRLGLRAIATDLNPVAVLINKALIEIPPKFAGMPPVNPESRRKAGMQSWKGAQGLAEDVRYYGKWMRDEAFKRIGHLYPQVDLPTEEGGGLGTVIAWLWARTTRCPNPACAAEMPLVRSFALSSRKGREAFIEPIVDQSTHPPIVTFRIRQGRGDPPAGTVKRSGAMCLACGATAGLSQIREQGRHKRLGQALLAVVTEGPSGRMYVAATPVQSESSRVDVPESCPDTPLPKEAMSFRVQSYGMTRHRDLFSNRQLVALTSLAMLVREAGDQVERDFATADVERSVSGGMNVVTYAGAVMTYLACALSKLSDWSSTICGFIPGYEKFSHTFSKHALPMTWDFAELNPFSEAVGNWQNHVEWVAAALGATPAQGVGHSRQADASQADNASRASALVCTDPPYYDNIGYADLSDFFYVWLRLAIAPVWPEHFTTVLVPKAAELIATPFRFGGNRNKAKEFFEEGLARAFGAIRSVHSHEFPLAVFYAFKQAEDSSQPDDEVPRSLLGPASTGWETMLEGLIQVGLEVIGTWPIRTERTGRSIAIGTNALASSIVLVCRKRADDAPTIDRTTFRRVLRQELPAALRHLQKGNIAPVDMAQASIGPGMAIYSRHARVLEPDGSAMPVRTALQLINQALDEYLNEQEGEFDADTRFAVTWFETRQFESGAYGEAETLAKARNVAVSRVAEAGLVHSAGGKVRLLRRNELPEDWDPAKDKRPTIWEATQHLIKRLETQGESGAAQLMSALGPQAAPARDLAYRLFTVCERKKWAEEARAYNGLVVSWPELEKLAAQAGRSSAKPQIELL